MSEVVTFEDAKKVLADIRYKDGWVFELRQEVQRVVDPMQNNRDAKEVWKLRLSCPVRDVLDGTERLAYGRWWDLPYLTKSDVARTAFIACLVMEEHECRELFSYKGKSIFGPHVDIDALAEIADQRENQPNFETEILD